MNRTVKIIFGIALAVLVILFVWNFSNIVFYILAAAVFSVIGRPMVHFFDGLNFGRFKIPHVISALLSLIILLVLIGSFVAIFVPLIAQQARIIGNIDTQSLAAAFREPLLFIDSALQDLSILKEDENAQAAILFQLQSLVSVATFTDVFNYIISFTGAFMMAVFSILFISFFFLKDETLFYKSFMLFIPEKHTESAARILNEVKRLLTRYFLGLCMELAAMITLLTLGLTIFGVQNALLIGFIGGLFNIIPYLGPLIGATIGIVLGITSSLSLGTYTSLLPLSITIASVFAVSNLIDNMLLQPIIYSTSVRAHPIEIFLVIIIAGSLFGIAGMILAVPAYTVLRVILREFFSEMRIVKKLTENM
ncbi:MAG: AI-2E family transporter [Lentimicrobium sp.]|nr:AI-2E family transporter [Lentimicrobium sp.]